MKLLLAPSSDKMQFLITSLRLSLGVIFLWFGALKVAGFNPVYEIVNSAFALFATDSGNIVLGLLEAAIGAGLIINKPLAITHIALLIHLSGTLMTFVLAPEIMFKPYFPILSLEGEFVFKNAVLALSGLVVFVYEKQNAVSKYQNP